MRMKLQEPVASQAAESVREVVDYYQRWMRAVAGAGREFTPAQQGQFDRLRQLRDYLAALAEQDEIVFEMDKSYANLVASCAVYSMETVADMMNHEGVNYEEWEHFVGTMKRLYAVALEFATELVRVVRRFDRTAPFPDSVKAIVEAVNAKVRTGDVRPMPAIERPVLSAAFAPGKILHAGSELGDQVFASTEQKTRNPMPLSASLKPIKDPGLAAGACVDLGIGGAGPISSDSGDLAEAGERPAGFQSAVFEPSGVREDVDVGVGPTSVVGQPLRAFSLNLEIVKETRLRTMLDMSHRRLTNAMECSDFRFAAMLLCSIVESIVIEMAIRRRHELRLRGTPDTWNLFELLQSFLQELGVQHEPRDVQELMSCRELLVPAVQLMHPIGIDREALVRMLDFAHRFVARAGFSAGKGDD